MLGVIIERFRNEPHAFSNPKRQRTKAMSSQKSINAV